MRRNRIRHLNRDYYEIIKQILQTVYSLAEGCDKSFEIAYRCQLDLLQFLYYRDMLLNRRLLLVSSKNRHNQRYEITPKGEHYLQLLGELENDLRAVTFA
jgi:predicted transcriptional regulator